MSKDRLNIPIIDKIQKARRKKEEEKNTISPTIKTAARALRDQYSPKKPNPIDLDGIQKYAYNTAVLRYVADKAPVSKRLKTHLRKQAALRESVTYNVVNEGRRDRATQRLEDHEQFADVEFWKITQIGKK